MPTVDPLLPVLYVGLYYNLTMLHYPSVLNNVVGYICTSNRNVQNIKNHV